MNLDQRSKVASEALAWIGTPYHHRASIKGAGVDCGQLAIAVYAACGLSPAIDTGDYPNDWHLHRNQERYLDFVLQYCKEIDAPKVGDLVVIKFGRTFSHGAIYIGDGEIVHAYVNRPVEVASLADFDRPKRYFEVIT